MNLRERCKKLAASQIGLGFDDATDELESFAREIRNDALKDVLKGIEREQSYREYRKDQDGSGVLACREIARYVASLKQSGQPASSEQRPSLPKENK